MAGISKPERTLMFNLEEARGRFKALVDADLADPEDDPTIGLVVYKPTPAAKVKALPPPPLPPIAIIRTGEALVVPFGEEPPPDATVIQGTKAAQSPLGEGQEPGQVEERQVPEPLPGESVVLVPNESIQTVVEPVTVEEAEQRDPLEPAPQPRQVPVPQADEPTTTTTPAPTTTTTASPKPERVTEKQEKGTPPGRGQSAEQEQKKETKTTEREQRQETKREQQDVKRETLPEQKKGTPPGRGQEQRP